MTVKTTTMEEFNRIYDEMDETGTYIMSIKVPDATLVTISKSTWRYVKDELNGLHDMTFTCVAVQYKGAPHKQFLFTSIHKQQLIRVVNFLDETLNYNKSIPVACSDGEFSGGYSYGIYGESAQCPLF
jgi:hypothetical protein